jgi:hypothetical protein
MRTTPLEILAGMSDLSQNWEFAQRTPQHVVVQILHTNN